MTNLKKETWGKLGLEFVSIVLGIFLALLANQWYEGKRNRDMGREALVHIREEIRANKREVERVLPQLEATQSLLNAYTGTEGKSMFAIVGEMSQRMDSGFQTPILQHGSWDSAQSTGLVKYIDYGIVRELSATASRENLVAKRSDRLLSLVYNPEVADPAKTPGLLITARLLGSDNIQTLKRLARDYDRNLTLIAKELD